jgi:acyl-CoA synthetase (AMP-forming)/AMP-acid ligase II
MLLVTDFLEQSAMRTPDKIALVCDGQRLSYAEIDSMANGFAHALQAHGVARGDRVVLFLPNCVELVVGIFGTLKANATFVIANATMKVDSLRYLLNNCRATALVASAGKGELVEELIANTPSLRLMIMTDGATADGGGANGTGSQNGHAPQDALPRLAFGSIAHAYSTTRPLRQCIDQDLACLIYTSGSTGEPKGVMSAHANVVFAASSIISYLKNVADDIVINVLPFSFDYGLYQLLMVFKFGGTLVLERSFAYPVQILKLMEREGVTGLPGVPTLFSLLLQQDLSAYPLRSLRYITNTAAALPGSHILQIQRMFPQATLFSMYGLTETKRTLYLPPEQLERRPDSVGIAIPGTEVWLVDEAGQRLGPNAVGELVIRGGHVMRGYWEAPEATAARYRPGPLPGERICYSGDLFRMDDEGYLYFVGRKDDIIKSRGEKVPPKTVENILYLLPDVLEAAVIGVPDPILGQAVKAFVVTRNGDLTPKQILLHCRAHLEDYMMPKVVEIVDSLPKTSSGKIKKTELA